MIFFSDLRLVVLDWGPDITRLLVALSGKDLQVITRTPPSAASLWEHPGHELAGCWLTAQNRTFTKPLVLDNSDGGQILPRIELKPVTL